MPIRCPGQLAFFLFVQTDDLEHSHFRNSFCTRTRSIVSWKHTLTEKQIMKHKKRCQTKPDFLLFWRCDTWTFSATSFSCRSVSTAKIYQKIFAELANMVACFTLCVWSNLDFKWTLSVFGGKKTIFLWNVFFLVHFSFMPHRKLNQSMDRNVVMMCSFLAMGLVCIYKRKYHKSILRFLLLLRVFVLAKVTDIRMYARNDDVTKSSELTLPSSAPVDLCMTLTEAPFQNSRSMLMLLLASFRCRWFFSTLTYFTCHRICQS